MGHMKAMLREKLKALSTSKKKLERAYTSSLVRKAENSRTKRSKYTKKEETEVNNQTQG